MVYVGILNEQGKTVNEEDAYEYALKHCLHGIEHEEFKEMLVEWYFSGSWIKAEEEE